MIRIYCKIKCSRSSSIIQQDHSLQKILDALQPGYAEDAAGSWHWTSRGGQSKISQRPHNYTPTMATIPCQKSILLHL